MSPFNLESYLEHSKKVDVSDLDFTKAANYPLSPDEVRCLTYMMDIETQVIVFLKEILATCAIRDQRTTAFLSCWAYEEFFHGHSLRHFLRAAGVVISPKRAIEVQKQASWRYWMESLGASLICQVSQHFHAVYLTWGAISELMTLESYGIVATRTGNPVLAELLRRLVKDERRHFAFYYHMANEQLAPRAAQTLSTWIIKHIWMPVGTGTRLDEEVNWMVRYIYGDAHGQQVAASIDATIRKLPGLGWFDRVTRSRQEILERFGVPEPPLSAVAASD